MPSFGSCPVRARNERFVLRHYAQLGIPVVKGAGRARAHAMNAAARAAALKYPERGVFIMCDNDLIPDAAFLHSAIDAAAKHPCVCPHGINRNLTDAGTLEVMSGGHPRVFEDTTIGARSYVVITRDNYASVNGMDEMFVGWGPEDKAFIYSVMKQLGQPLLLEGVRLHLWHPTDPTKRDARQLSRNRLRARKYMHATPERARVLAREYGRWSDGAGEQGVAVE